MDKNEFFRQATLKICSSLNIEDAFSSLLTYIQDYIPAGSMCIELYEKDYGSMRCLATITRECSKRVDILIPLSEQARAIIQEIHKPDHPSAFLFESTHRNCLVQELQQFFGTDGAGAMVLFLMSDHQQIVAVGAIPHQGQHFTQEHLDLFSLLREPLSIAVSNSIRHLEVVRLKDILKDDNSYLQGELRRIAGDSIVGGNFGLKEVLRKVGQVAQLDSPVLLLGETGVGKDVIANAIHNHSTRTDGPFIVVNCGAIPESLMDSELFGYEKGAFTGAVAQRRGRFERAHGGTIFLDEIGELPLQAQVRLLRVLQDRTIERVGGTETIALDIRIIAATNRNLEEMVKASTFREDLWFRLNVFPIHIPPLRERTADIPALLKYFIGQKMKEMKLHTIPSLAPGAMDTLVRYHWPGNVRELQNIVERALIINPTGPIDFSAFLQTPARDTGKIRPESESVEDLDSVVAEHIKRALEQTKGRIHGPNGTAALLGMNPSTLRHRMRKLGIKFGRVKEA
jgi:transcriptional regulator with GAF, ATPase, and Fis domain